MKIKETVGIDIGKKSLDACIHTKQLSQIFDNSKKGFLEMCTWYRENSDCPANETLFVFEHTGLYSERLSEFLFKKKIPFVLVPGLEIKRSLGMSRGKSDKKDAAAIARYAFRRRDELEPQGMPEKDVACLKRLLSLRTRLVAQRSGFKASIREQKLALKGKGAKFIIDTQAQMVGHLDREIKKIERELKLIIAENGDLVKIFALITGIKGIGEQTALFMIAYTHGFTKFENARKFASYCGIAPFPNESGSSLRGRTKVSHLANKKIKSLLDMCAKSAIRTNKEMRSFYMNKIDQGKNRRSTINIIRNKLLARVFAVVKRGTPYVDTMKYAA